MISATRGDLIQIRTETSNITFLAPKRSNLFKLNKITDRTVEDTVKSCGNGEGYEEVVSTSLKETKHKEKTRESGAVLHSAIGHIYLLAQRCPN